jgi:hypothetical protein
MEGIKKFIRKNTVTTIKKIGQNLNLQLDEYISSICKDLEISKLSTNEQLINELYPFQVRIPSLGLAILYEECKIPNLKEYLSNQQKEVEDISSKKVKTTVIQEARNQDTEPVAPSPTKSDNMPKSVLKKHQNTEAKSQVERSTSNPTLSPEKNLHDSQSKVPISPRSPDKINSKMQKRSEITQKSPISLSEIPQKTNFTPNKTTHPSYILKEEVDDQFSDKKSDQKKAKLNQNSKDKIDELNEDLGILM